MFDHQPDQPVKLRVASNNISSLNMYYSLYPSSTNSMDIGAHTPSQLRRHSLNIHEFSFATNGCCYNSSRQEQFVRNYTSWLMR